MTTFKCMWATEPVSECPPVKELNRLRDENRRLKNEIRKMQEDADKPAASPTTWVDAGEDEQRSERAFEPARKRDDTELVRTTEEENRKLREGSPPQSLRDSSPVGGAKEGMTL